jgi:hypothetical protein
MHVTSASGKTFFRLVGGPDVDVVERPALFRESLTETTTSVDTSASATTPTTTLAVRDLVGCFSAECWAGG